MVTLGRKALKKVATKEVFEEILNEVNAAMQEEPSQTANKNSKKRKKQLIPLTLDIKKLQKKMQQHQSTMEKIKR